MERRNQELTSGSTSYRKFRKPWFQQKTLQSVDVIAVPSSDEIEINARIAVTSDRVTQSRLELAYLVLLSAFGNDCLQLMSRINCMDCGPEIKHL